MVNYIYEEASSRLTESISSPLGTLTLSQIEKGEALLIQIYDILQEKYASGEEKEKASVTFGINEIKLTDKKIKENDEKIKKLEKEVGRKSKKVSLLR